MRKLSIILCVIFILAFSVVPVFAASYDYNNNGYDYYVLVKNGDEYTIYYTNAADGSSSSVLMYNFATVNDALLYLETGEGKPTGNNQTTTSIKWLANSDNCLYGNVSFCSVSPPFAVSELVKSFSGINLSAVLSQVIALLPVCVSVLVGFIGLRKAISFVQGVIIGA